MTNELLPGGDLVERGIADLQNGLETIPAMLVSIGSPRLRSLGFRIPARLIERPEHRLYEVLAAEDGQSAHSRYNALIRRLVSFERAARCVR